MLREGYIRLNLQNIDRFNEKTQRNHEKNMKKIKELKNAYLDKANQIKQDAEIEIKEKNIEIAKLKNQIEFLKKQRDFIKDDLNRIPDFYKI